MRGVYTIDAVIGQDLVSERGDDKSDDLPYLCYLYRTLGHQRSSSPCARALQIIQISRSTP